jgi:hypothetical protein
MHKSGIGLLFFCQLFPPAVFGGGELMFSSLSKQLAKKGHRVFVVTSRLRGTSSRQTVEGVDYS